MNPLHRTPHPAAVEALRARAHEAVAGPAAATADGLWRTARSVTARLGRTRPGHAATHRTRPRAAAADGHRRRVALRTAAAARDRLTDSAHGARAAVRTVRHSVRTAARRNRGRTHTAFTTPTALAIPTAEASTAAKAARIGAAVAALTAGVVGMFLARRRRG
ncbi:hypothetical protein ACFV0O_01810 [Kitasatospora sp. NPDC059577]|uniref:hypothetical protein n=1 Tax=unclassified Kitasatospora TaxID=2633591 RepID=UPI003679C336